MADEDDDDDDVQATKKVKVQYLPDVLEIDISLAAVYC
jgi:hypothetical protein